MQASPWPWLLDELRMMMKRLSFASVAVIAIAAVVFLASKVCCPAFSRKLLSPSRPASHFILLAASEVLANW